MDQEYFIFKNVPMLKNEFKLDYKTSFLNMH